MAAATVLCACSGAPGLKGNGEAEPIAVEIWHYYNGAQKLAFDQLVTEFNETEGIEKNIVVEAFGQGSVNELAKTLTDAAEKKVGSADMPDVFSSYSDTVYELDKKGLVASLDKYLSEEELGSYVDGYIKEGFFGEDGTLKIFPTAKSSEVMMLNKTDWEPFSVATGADETDMKTVEGLVKTAKSYYEWTDAATPEPNDGKAMFGRDAFANYMLIGYRQITGSDIFTVEGGKATLSLGKAAVRRLWDNYYLPYMNGWFGAYGRFRSDDVKTGDLIALVGSTTGAVYFPDAVMTDDAEGYPITATVLETPMFEGGTPCLVQQGAGMAVSKGDERAERASVEFLKWFTEPERNMRFCAESGYLPVKKSANTVEMIHAAIGDDAPPNVKGVLESVVNSVSTKPMYVGLPFDGSEKARPVLEHSMPDRAKADSEAVASLVAAGTPREEALAKYLTDENFDGWYEEFTMALQSELQSAE